MGELMGAFDRSKEEGQAQWKRAREPVLRRRAAAEAWEKSEQVKRHGESVAPQSCQNGPSGRTELLVLTRNADQSELGFARSVRACVA